MKVGITGGIGAGKSIVCKVFSVLGVPVYNADSRAKYLMNTDQELMLEITKLYGDQAYGENGLNRTFLAKKSFNSPDILMQLNQLVHPKVDVDFNNWYSSRETAVKYVLKEAALLFESGSYKSLDAVVLVTAPKQLRIQRVLTRDPHRTKQDVLAIIDKQLPEEKKKVLADFTIINDNKLMILPAVLKLHESFLKM